MVRNKNTGSGMKLRRVSKEELKASFSPEQTKLVNLFNKHFGLMQVTNKTKGLWWGI